MPPAPKYRNEPWLQSPLRTPVGEIELAGMLRNVTGIDPTGMRILRRFTLVLMVEGRGYYRGDDYRRYDGYRGRGRGHGHGHHDHDD